jgi:PKD repeat protein
MDPTPIPSYEFTDLMRDFIVLKLKVKQPESNVIKVNKICKKEDPPSRPFYLHHPLGEPMQISYDYKTPYSIDFIGRSTYSVKNYRTYYGQDGSSGGGLFWGDNFSGDPRNGELLGLVSRVENKSMVSGPRILNVFDKKIGATRLLSGSLLGEYLTPSDINTIWEQYTGVPASSPTNYKYKTKHLIDDCIWYSDGSLTNGAADVIKLNQLANAPEGKYKIFIKLIKSTTSYNGLQSSGGNVSLALDFDNSPTWSYRSVNIGSISDIDLYTKTMMNCNTGISCNENYAYSDLVEFELKEVTLTAAQLISGPLYFKFHSLLKTQDNTLSGLSIHGIRIEYVETDNDNIPWYKDNCPCENNPEQLDTDNDGIGDVCDKVQSSVNEIGCRTINFFGKVYGNTEPIYIGWGDGAYTLAEPASTDIYEHKWFSSSSNRMFSSFYNVNKTHLYPGKGPYRIYYYTKKSADKYEQWGTQIAKETFTLNCPQTDMEPELISNVPDKISGVLPLKVEFSNTGSYIQNQTGLLKFWYVDFGDGTKEIHSDLAYPPYDYKNMQEYNNFKLKPNQTDLKTVHVYNSIGTYALTIKAQGTQDALFKEKVVSVEVKPQAGPPELTLTYDVLNFSENSQICKFYTMNEFESTRDALTSWYWDFGDGATSTEESPVHEFIRDINYKVFTVTLKAKCQNSEESTKSILFSLYPKPPVVNFTADKQSIGVNKNVAFTMQNTGGVFSYVIWEFGDGSISMELNPVHKYTKPGLYTVKLIAVGKSFPDVEEKTGYIRVSSGIGPILQLLLE